MHGSSSGVRVHGSLLEFRVPGFGGGDRAGGGEDVLEVELDLPLFRDAEPVHHHLHTGTSLIRNSPPLGPYSRT